MTIDLATRCDLMDLYAAYAACLDAGRFDEWPAFFTEDCRYRVQPRENHDRGYRLDTMSLVGRGGLRDRVYGVQKTLFHAPYYQRHLIGPVFAVRGDNNRMEAEVNYAVFRTKRDQLSEVFNVGRYLDTVVRTADGLLFADKLCVFDSELVPNSIIYPI